MVGEMTWSSSASSARVIKSSTQLSKEDWRDNMELWRSSASPARVIQSSTQVSKDGWRDDVEFFCINFKSN
jgi:hypothetical protein